MLTILKNSKLYNSEIILYLRRIIYNFLAEYINPEGKKGINRKGYRNYVGFDYELYGNAIYNSIITELGLKKSDIFLDLGCGSLRYGRFLIKFLDKNCYVGFDKEQLLIDLALEKEISSEIIKVKNPQFIINSSFDFSEVNSEPNFIFANSLFTHLNTKDINTLIKNLLKITKKNFVFYTSIHFSKYNFKFFGRSHPHRNFSYSMQQIERILIKHELSFEYIGRNWGHPGNLHLIKIFK